MEFSTEADRFFEFWFAGFLNSMTGLACGLMAAFMFPGHQVVMIFFGITQSFWWLFNGLFVKCECNCWCLVRVVCAACVYCKGCCFAFAAIADLVTMCWSRQDCSECFCALVTFALELLNHCADSNVPRGWRWVFQMCPYNHAVNSMAISQFKDTGRIVVRSHAR